MSFVYQPAGYHGEKCPGTGPTAGSRAQMAAWEKFSDGMQHDTDELGLGSDGIFNPRPIRGSTTTWSVHAVGRAGDNRCNAHDPIEKAIGDAWAGWMITHWEPLGVQYLIWTRRSWRPDRGWKPYTGVDPHTGHLHVEENIDGASHPSPLWATITGTPADSAPKVPGTATMVLVEVGLNIVRAAAHKTAILVDGKLTNQSKAALVEFTRDANTLGHKPALKVDGYPWPETCSAIGDWVNLLTAKR